MDKKDFPKSVSINKQVYGHGGVRVYEVAKEEAKEIAKEFKLPFQRNNEPATYYYMNISRRGVKQHVVFAIDEKKEK